MVVARIERYKLEHPTMFAWEIKEKLLREGIQPCFSLEFGEKLFFSTSAKSLICCLCLFLCLAWLCLIVISHHITYSSFNSFVARTRISPELMYLYGSWMRQNRVFAFYYLQSEKAKDNTRNDIISRFMAFAFLCFRIVKNKRRKFKITKCPPPSTIHLAQNQLINYESNL